MNPITDLRKWAEKTAQVVRRICLSKVGPCVGICLLFLEHNEKGEKMWNFTIHMAGDANTEMDNAERKKLERAMEVGAKAMQMAFDDPTEELEGHNEFNEFMVKGRFRQ